MSLPASRVVIAAVLLAGLAWGGGAPASAQPESQTLRRIRDTGVIVLGYRATSMPFSYLDANLRPVGYSVELCERVVDEVRTRLNLPDLETKFVAVSSATRLPLMANGTLDLECGVTTDTVERRKTQSFSITTFVAEIKLLSRKSAPIYGIDDLRGKPVATTIGTTSIQYLHNLNLTRKLDIKITVGQDDQEAFRMLQTDRAVAFAMDDVLLRSQAAQTGNPAEYMLSDAALSVEPYGLGLLRDDPQFKQVVDGVIVGLFQRGQIFDIYKKWFQAPIPPRGINLNLPMSEAFKRVIRKPTDSPDPLHYR